MSCAVVKHDVKQWIDENKHKFLPPVCNECMLVWTNLGKADIKVKFMLFVASVWLTSCLRQSYLHIHVTFISEHIITSTKSSDKNYRFSDQLKVFFIGGPNSRKDYHNEEGVEVSTFITCSTIVLIKRDFEISFVTFVYRLSTWAKILEFQLVSASIGSWDAKNGCVQTYFTKETVYGRLSDSLANTFWNNVRHFFPFPCSSCSTSSTVTCVSRCWRGGCSGMCTSNKDR